MHSRDWPEAIATATGYSPSWCRQVLRALREAELLPDGRYRPRLSSRHVALVVLGLSAANVSAVADHVRSLDQLPARVFPSDIATAGLAIAKVTDDLLASKVRALGLVEINSTWSAVTIHVVDDADNPIQRFGCGDHAVHRLVASLTAVPLASILGTARVLTTA